MSKAPPHPAPRLRLTGALPPTRPPLFFWGVLAPLRVGILPAFSRSAGVRQMFRWVFRWVGQFSGARARVLGARFPSAQPAPPCPFARAGAVFAPSPAGIRPFSTSPCSCSPPVTRMKCGIFAGSPSWYQRYRKAHQKRPPTGSLYLCVMVPSKFKKGVQWQLQSISNVFHGCYGWIIFAILNA